jgi:uncharacterized membrane protein YhhN
LTVFLLLAAAVLGSLHIRADYRQQWSLTYILKPLTMVAIIGVVVSSGVGEMGFYRLAVIAGLVLSLIGDVFLMLRPSRFLAGLSAFLLAHIVYVTAFFSRLEAFHAVALGLPAFVGLAMFMLIRRGAGRMALPISIYILAIAGMVGTSLSAAIDQPDAGRLAAAAGALLFLFSDATIGVVRFHTRFHLGQALILGSYYPAQALIALSAGALFA